jgi:hypothetical protein
VLRVDNIVLVIRQSALPCVITWLLGICGPTIATEPVPLDLLRPQSYEVVQRQGFDPHRAHEHEPGGPVLGFALVPVEIDLSRAKIDLGGDAVFEYRVVPLVGGTSAEGDWSAAEGRRQERSWSAAVRVPAGGWYRLEVRTRLGERILATTRVEPIGVGEVFLIAGQSYAVGANDELTKVDDPQGRVVAYDVVNKKWRVANDPQPNAGEGGTIWPTTGNHLVTLTRVPIGFVNVAVGGTSTRQWLPGEKLYEELAAAGKTTGRFRAVLWQQGESDVIEHRSTE